jgi:cell division protein ZapA
MAQVTVTINGKRYDIACDDGQEAHVLRLAEEVDGRVGRLVDTLGQVGEARLLLLAALLLADEAGEVQGELARLREAAQPHAGATGQPAPTAALDSQIVALAERIEAAAGRLAAATIAGRPGPP